MEGLKVLFLAVIAGATVAQAVLTYQQTETLSKDLARVRVAAKAGGGGGGNAAPSRPSEPENLDPSPYLNDRDAGWGPKDAKVTIVEFTDFQCPFCKRYAQQTAGQIREKYGDKVRFVLKHLPLKSIHPHATGAAIASQCANQQGKFWEYYDILFENQRNLAASELEGYAKELGLDLAKFKDCMQDEDTAQKVEADLKAAISLGVTGTPGFIIGNKKVSGAQPFARFDAEIEKALAAN